MNNPTNPAPFEIVNETGRSPVLLTCEHAGRAIPQRLGDLGLAASEMERHIAYDLGAEALARQLSRYLDATLILQPYSRLVVDCNRPPEAFDCVPEHSDGTSIPANLGLSSNARQQRIDEIHTPFHTAIKHLLDARESAQRPTLLISVHSFTPQLKLSTQSRPWHIGFLYNRDERVAQRLFALFEQQAPTIVAALNQPYDIDDEGDYTIPIHGEQRAIPHVLLELRNDLITTPNGQARWAELLGDVINDLLAKQSEDLWPITP